VDPRRRRELTRYGAPAAFLAAVTIAVLLIKSGLSGSGSNETTAVFSTIRTRATTTQQSTSSARTTTVSARYYVIQSGDTLGAIATQQNTTVAELLRLNPGINPNGLHSGQRIRVG
jgi:LysM repeat protein